MMARLRSNAWSGLRSRQRGTTTVEFAIVGAVVFLVMFAVMEVGRLMYTWGVLNETSRRAARLATVCMVEQVQDGTVATAVATQMGGALPGFTAANLAFDYLKVDGTASVPAHGASYVRSRIVNYRYDMILPLTVDLSRFAPDFATTLRTESMGRTKPTAANPNGEIICTDTGGATT